MEPQGTLWNIKEPAEAWRNMMESDGTQENLELWTNRQSWEHWMHKTILPSVSEKRGEKEIYVLRQTFILPK